MKTKLCLLSIPFAFLITACGPKDDASKASDSEAPSQTQEALQKSWSDTKDALAEGSAAVTSEFNQLTDKVGDWSKEQADKLKSDYQGLEKKMDAQVAEWKSQSADFSASAKQQWNEGLQEFQKGKEDLSATWNKMSNASADNWDAAKANLESAWDEVEQGFSKMKAAATESDASSADSTSK